MWDCFCLFFARLGFAGKSPVMPGTSGSLLAILLAPWIFMPQSFEWRLVTLFLVFIAGTYFCYKAEELLCAKDPQQVVIDELWGQWIVCLPFMELSLAGYVAAFLLFRLFDITKPWPVKYLERFSGGFGVMLDDGMAGIYAMLVLAGLHWLFA